MKECIGGAANLAANVRALGAQCQLLSIIGDDESGRLLDNLLADSGVERNLHVDSENRTTEKLRVVSLNQQLIRIDFEGAPINDGVGVNIGIPHVVFFLQVFHLLSSKLLICLLYTSDAADE